MWRCIFRRGQIAPAAWTTLWACAARASATASPTAAPAAITAAVSTAIAAATVTAPAKILAWAIVAAAGWIVLRGIVMGREVLWRGSVGIRLALLSRFGVLIFHGSGVNFVVMFLETLTVSGVRFIVGSVLLIHRMGFVLVELLLVRFLVMI